LPAAVAAFGTRPQDLVAWLGPAIDQAAYEVGADVRDAFAARHPAAHRHFAPNRRGRWQADLYGLARDAFAALGVESVHGGGFCTYTEAERFFSHRCEAPCGRMATLIWLDPRP
jgi:copper oxidase (laccase) domain-containing protein